MAFSIPAITAWTAVTVIISCGGVGLSVFSVFCLLRLIRHLPYNLRILTASLFTGDVMVFIGLPGFCYLQLTQDMDKNFCVAILFLLPCATNAQFQHHALISVDRYLAVSRPLRYKDLVTRKKLAIAISISWTISLSIGATMTLGEPVGPVNICSGLVSITTSSVGLCVYSISGLAIAFSYVMTFRIARRHHREMNKRKLHIPQSLSAPTITTGVTSQDSQDQSQSNDMDNPGMDPDSQTQNLDDSEKRSPDLSSDDGNIEEICVSVSTASNNVYEDFARMRPTTTNDTIENKDNPNFHPVDCANGFGFNHTEHPSADKKQSTAHAPVQDDHSELGARREDTSEDIATSPIANTHPALHATHTSATDQDDRVEDTSFTDTLRSTKVSAIILCYYVLSWVPIFILGMGTIHFGASTEFSRLLLALIPTIMTVTGMGHSLLYFGIQRRVRRVVKRRLCLGRDDARRQAQSFTFW